MRPLSWKSRGAPAFVVALLSLLVGVPLVVAGTFRSEPKLVPAESPVSRAAALPACTIVGSAASETLVGTSGDDVICAKGGDDLVRGRGGDDVLFGSFGDDVVEGGPGNDRLYGHFGRDRLRGGRGRDFLQGGGNADIVSGGSGPDIADYGERILPVRVSIGVGANDGRQGERDDVRASVERVRGGHAGDTLIGNADANRLHGAGGDDLLNGKRGDDRLRGGAGVDRLDGRDGDDFADGLRCGPGEPDQADADARDSVASDCERIQKAAPPGGRNRPPTDITLSDSSVEEDRPLGTVVGTLEATDADAGDTHTFALVNGAGDADNGSFAIVGDQLRTAAVFDFEVKSSYTIRVRVRDARGATFRKALQITITDVSENRAPTDITLSPASIAEGEPSGATIGTFAATDTNPGDAHTYTLVPGTGSDDNGAFAIDGNQLETAQVFNYESKNSYSLRVRVTDSGSPALSFEKAFTVTVTDVNEAPFALTLSDDTLPENEPAGTTVGNLSVSDVDAGQTHAFTLVAGAGDADNGKFTITGSTLTIGQPLDFEAQQTYSIRVRATDDGSPALSVENTFVITVTDTLEAPTAAGKSAATDEDTPVTVTLSATDPEGDDVTSFVTSAPNHGVAGPVGAITCAGAPKVCTADVVFTPDVNYNGPAGFSYTASDGVRVSVPASVSITVAPVNDAPVATAGSRTTDEDTPLTLNLAALVSDVETADADLSYEIVSQPAHGTATATTYTPAADYNGPDSFTYRVTDRGDPDDCSGAPCDGEETSTTETVSITVAPVNDTPQASGDSVSVNEDDSVGLDLSALVSDVETADANLTYTIVSPPANGGLSGSGASRTYTPAADFAGTDSFTYEVTDRGDPDNCGAPGPACDAAMTSGTATVSITVNPVNDAPVNSLPAGPVVALPGAATPLTGISIADVDAGTADVEVELSVDHGTLTVNTLVTGGVTAADVTGNGTASVTVTASLAQINATLANATGLVYQPDAGFGGPDTLTVATDDLGNTGAGGAKTDTDTLAIAVDNVPLADAKSVTTDEDTPTTITLSASDADGDPIQFSIASGPAHGSLGTIGSLSCSLATPNVCTADVLYTPNPNYNGPDSFTYTASDGLAPSAPATVSITVDPVNDAPQATAGSRSTDEDTPLTLNLDALVSDVETADANLTYEIVSQPAHGTATATTYTPAADFNGTDSFTYRVTDRGDPDDCGAPGPACDGPLTSTTETVSITVNPVNDAPLATAGSRTTDEDTPLMLNLAALVSDVETADGDLTYEIVAQPAHGTATATTYTPDGNYNGPDGLTYRVTDRGDPDNCGAPGPACDGPLTSTTETVSITVNPVNDAPVATAGSRSTDEDTPLTLNLDALVSDVETADANLTYEIVSQPAHGTATATTYTPAADFNGTDSFTYRVIDRGDPDNCGAPGPACDGPLTSTTETVTITVGSANDAPTASPLSASTDEDVSLPVNLAALVSDPETADADLTYTIVTPPAHGVLTGSGGARTYTPAADFNGADSFTYEVTDRGDPDNCGAPGPACAAPLTSTTETVSITVNPVNDAPLASPTSVSVDEDQSVGIDLAALVSDLETADGDLTYEIVSGPSDGDLTGSGGSRTYSPDADFNGADSFTYRVVDRGDPDNCGAPGPACDAAETSSTETASITVNPVNDAPLASSTSVSVDEDDSVGIDLAAIVSDVETADGDLTYEIVSGPSDGDLTGSGGSRTYSPDPDFTGADSFTYRVTDRGDPDNCGAPGPACDAPLTSTTETVSITVNAVNDAPVIVLPAGPVTAVQDTDTPIAGISITDVDAAGDDVAVELKVDHGVLMVDTTVLGGVGALQVVGSGTGTVQIVATLAQINTTLASASGLVYHSEPPAYTGPDALAVSVSDLGHNGSGGPLTDSESLAIDVVPPNVAPVANAQSVSTNEDMSVTVTLSASDADGDALSFAIASVPSHGSLGPIIPITSSTATVVYTPDADFNGPDSFTYTANDGTVDSAPATVSITVNPVNDAPRLENIEGGALAYTENAAATVITATTTVADIDSANFDTGTLTVDYSAGGTADDRLEIRNQGTGAGQIGVSGGTVSFGGTTIGTFTGGTGTTALVVTLNANATAAAAQALVRNITYRNVSDTPATAATVRFVLTDGDGGTSAPATRAIAVTPVNDAPVLAAIEAGALAYTENAAATPITATTTVADVDSTNFDTGTLTVDYSAGGTVDDRLEIRNQGTGAGQIGVSGNSVTFGGTTIGTFAGGSGATPLVVTFNASATPAAVQALVRNVTYRSVSDNPATSATVRFGVSDGDGGTSAAVTRAITVTPVNDAPVLAGIEAGALPYTENAAATVITATTTVADVDSTNFDTGTLTVDYSLGGTADDRFEIRNEGIGAGQIGVSGASVTFGGVTIGTWIGGSGTTALVVTLNASATPAAVQALVRNITYRNVSDNPSTAPRTARFVLTDGDGGTSAAATRAIALTAVNDAPVVNLDVAGALTYPEQNGFTNLFGPAATVTDVDSATLDSLTVTITSGFDAAFDTLDLNTAGFTTNFTGGVLTITRAGGTLAEFTTALRNVRFRNTDDDPDDRNDGTPNPSVADRTVSVVADDGPDTSTPVTRNVTITPINDAPGAPSPLPSASSVRNTTLVSGTNSVTHPKVTRTIDLRGNSTDPDGLESAITVVPAAAAATVQGGRITLNAAGDLVYEPPFSTSLASDTYGYQLTDGTTASAAITFTVNLAGDPIYVADQSPAPEDGTAARPFDVLADAIAVTGGHPIHIRRAPGDGTLPAGITLTAGDKLLGEGVALTSAQVGAPAGDTLFAAGTKPILTASGTDVVTLAANAEIAGLTINPDGAANGVVGNAVAGITLRSMDINDTGTAASQPGIELTGTGNGLTLSGTVDVAMQSNRAVSIAGAALSGVFTNVTVTASSNGGVSLTNTTGSLTFQTLSLTTTGGTGFLLSNAANIDVDGAGFAASVSSSGGPAVDATTLTNGSDLVFDSVSASGTPAKGVNLDGTGGWTFSAAAGAISGATNVGFDVNGGSGAVSYAGSIANGTGEAVDITARSGNTTISGNITGAGGTGVNVANNTGGTTTFSGTTKTLNTGTNQAVTLSSNTGHTINFTGGGLDIDTTSGTGFGAAGGGTIGVTGTGNSATATTGTALSVTGTTIGASDLNFQSISSSGGSATGIILDTTGTTGGLTVTGDGTNTTRGGNGSGGTIANKSGADGATTTGNAIYLNSAAQVTLRRMTINGTNANFGILATNSREIALEFSTVNGANGNNVALDEGSISYSGLTVSGSIADSIVGGGFEDNLRLVNTSGSLNRMVISNSTFDQTGGASSNNNLLIESQNAGTVLNFTLQGSTIRGARADWVNAASNSSSSMDAVISGNTFSNLGASANANAAPGGNRLVLGTIGTLTYNIDANSLNGSLGEAMRVRGSGAASGLTGTAIGRITNNLIGTAATANSGSSEGSGIFIFGDGGSDNTTLISGNTIRQYNNHAISVTFGDEINNGAVNNVTVTNNNANTPGTVNDNFNGFSLNNGTVGATDDFTSCLELANNNFTASGKGAIAPNNGDIRLRQRMSTTVRLPGYSGPARDTNDNDVAEVVTFLRPPASGGVKSNTFGTGFAGSVSTGGGYVGTGGACVTPP